MIRLLVGTGSFPLDKTALTTFDLLHEGAGESNLYSIDECCPFVAEYYASEVAISVTLT